MDSREDINRAYRRANDGIDELFNGYRDRLSDSIVYQLLCKLENSIKCFKQIIKEPD